MTKKVLYLCPNAYLGGAERAVLDAVQGHLTYGTCQPHLLFFGREGKALEEARCQNLPHSCLKTPFRLSRPLSLMKAVWELRTFIKRQGFDLYNATMPYAHIVGALACVGLPIKRTWFQHGPVAGRLDTLASFFPVDHLFFNSRATQRAHQNSLLYQDESERSIIHYGIHQHSQTTQSDDFPQVAPDHLLLLSAGRLCPWKGQEVAIEALAKLYRHRPSLKRQVSLWIVGDVGREKDQDYKQFLIDLVRQGGLDHHVHFFGHRSDLPQFFKRCDFFLHTSLIPEPFGLVVAEAMLHDCFVIGSNDGGVTDILKNGQTGFSFGSTGPHASQELFGRLLQAIDLYHHQPREFKSIKEQARKLIAHDYTIENMTTQLETVYQRL